MIYYKRGNDDADDYIVLLPYFRNKVKTSEISPLFPSETKKKNYNNSSLSFASFLNPEKNLSLH